MAIKTNSPAHQKIFERKRQLRQKINAQRKQLAFQQHQQYAQQFKRQIQQCRPILRAQRIGIYHPINGEAPANLIAETVRKTAQVFVPKVLNYPQRIMRFTPMKHRMKKNRWGILEAVNTHRQVSVKQLDVLIMPLVAFDMQGNRLGMGGGFYDRALAYKQHQRQHSNKPLLIGLAYDFQHIEALPTEDWDIGLDMVVTNRQVIYNQPPKHNG